MDCIFCRIIAKKASGSLIFEDGLAATFLDTHPVTEGHLLIVPKIHVERFSKLPDHVAAHLFGVARKVFLHLAPRSQGDGQRMGSVHADPDKWPRSRLDAVAEKIRRALQVNSENEAGAAQKFLPQPVIETPRLKLRTYRREDANDIFAYASDPKVARFVPWQHHQSLEDAYSFLKYVEQSTSYDRKRLFYIFAMEDKATGRVIGSIDFKKIHDRMGQVDYAMGVSHWGKGFMSEAGIAVRDWAFRNLLELERLQAYCAVANRGSSRVMEKMGMKFEGLREKAFLLKNEPVDVDNYAILRREWRDPS